MLQRFARRTNINVLVLWAWIFAVLVYFVFLYPGLAFCQHYFIFRYDRVEFAYIGIGYIVGITVCLISLCRMLCGKIRLTPKTSTQEMMFYFCLLLCWLGFYLGGGIQ